MKVWKKILFAVLALVVIVAILAITGCMPVKHSNNVSGRIVYENDQVVCEKALTQAEIKTLITMINCKVGIPQFLSGEYACGFSEHRSIQVGEVTYYVSQDDCGVLQNASTGAYYQLTNEEWNIIKELFTAHGAQNI